MVWSVRNRLRALSLCWVLSLVLLGGMGLHWLRQETDLAQRFLDNDFVAAVEVGEIRAALGHMRRYEKEMFLDMGDEQRLAALTRDWQAQLATVQRTMESLRPRVDAASLASVDAFDAGVQAYAKGVLAVLEAIRVGQINDPWKADEHPAMHTGKAGMAAADRAFDALRTAMQDKARQQTAGMQSSTDLALYSSATALLVFGLLALVLARGIGRSVVMPLDQACSLADAVARGDLTHVIDADGHDEIAQLRRALIRMQSSLAEVVGTLQHTATDIETATHEVAGGNHDLSHRTERAASHLQETAASLHELTTAVAQSSSTASQALVVVQQVAESAQASGAAVSGFVTTMQAIQTSSKRISEITAVIDGIAFQTNILALNAAVEAARAGEQGRGFSVVAAEVRQLARRSGEAAREIRGLIVNAGQLVARGSADVARAGTHVHSLVQGVQQVREYVQVMAHNTHEQDRGLGQIHQAVEQIDQMTQQNAALVEESAAAAQSLRDQAARLAEVVRSFQVDPAKAPAVAYRVLPQLT